MRPILAKAVPVFSTSPQSVLRTFVMTTPFLRSNPRRFAPLRGGAGEGNDAPKLKGIVFDVDGTLWSVHLDRVSPKLYYATTSRVAKHCSLSWEEALQELISPRLPAHKCAGPFKDTTVSEPQTYMFQQMRDAVSIPKGSDILDHIYALPTPAEQEAAMEKIRAVERAAMASQAPQPGLMPLMTYLDSRSLPKGICTRNFDAPVTHLLGKFLPGHTFAPIVTRDFRPPKPDPAGILHIAKSWGLDGGEGLIMVGDSIDDMTAGRRAGAATVLLVNDINRHLSEHEHTDLIVSRLDELIEILENGFLGKTK